MSIISSEGLGSSQLISSERMKSARNVNKKNFGVKVDQLQEYHNFVTHKNKVVFSEDRINNLNNN